jgi:hypothetical protein
MPMSTRLTALASAAALTAPASAHAQQPTLQFDRNCYTEQQAMRFTGAGYTPGGHVDVIFARGAEPRGGYSTIAGAGGELDDVIGVDTADQFLPDESERETMFVTANDRTRIEADQQPPESQFGFAQFTFTRWAGFSPGRYVPGKRATVEIYGWAFAAGKPAWFLFRKGSRTIAAVNVGRLDDKCGDLTARIKVPRAIKPGRYRVVLTTDRKLRDRYTWRTGRVTPRRSVASAASADAQAMARAGA